ncbi:LGFP repeat-containing protein [Kineococcus xinjiangensis]|uniref:LGFP repeat-containing protein n=1 Tax=Kineococcus xinjiangensis TaxID=512762 RepID=A0A2S6IH02_9ACTN|nr:family 43 glycosylhydrolase [Kineococcus xinjiangensis]PPK93495.1 LGFP repeat-containing protein [Kineococcus xinjiangensis]
MHRSPHGSPRLRAPAALALATALLTACTGSAGDGGRSADGLDSERTGSERTGAEGTDPGASGRTSSEQTWFEPGTAWVGDFGDPHVVLHEGTYYAYASPVGGRYLPVLTSTDLETWTVHPRWSDDGPPGRPGYDPHTDEEIPREIREAGLDDWGTYDLNDALVRPASWGLHHQQGPWLSRDLWASSAFPLGDAWYAYSAVRVSPDRFCLTVASAPSPLGPFRDVSGDAPIQCQPVERDPGGSIDPSPYTDPATGRSFLLWKASGKPDVRPSSLQAVELGADGKPLPGAPVTTLLETNHDAAWEGDTIENPSMVTHRGTTYLFYSANYSGVLDADGRSNYASGYAICPQGPLGPCTRPDPQVPLLGSEGERQGPGGSAGFVDAEGELRMAYAAFRLGENLGGAHPHPRRMGIVTLEQAPDGRLTVQGQQRDPAGAVTRAAEQLAGTGGDLGRPLGPVQPTPDGRGWFQAFERGWVYSAAATGAHAVRGAVAEAWLATGAESGPLGFPTTDEARTPGGGGTFAHFEGGSVYASPRTGAHWVRGAIRTAWGDSGWEAGPLGFPVSDEQVVPGGWRSDFEGGSITVDAATGQASTTLTGGAGG